MSVKLDGVRTHKQKRLLLLNLKELHLEFMNRTGIKIGLSKFCSLRPPWCLTVDSAGSHSVCVCEVHQNLKLMVAALPGTIDYKDILMKCVCNVESRDCMLHYCSNCPGRDSLKEMLEEMFDQANTDLDDTVNYQQWTHGGQSKLQTVEQTVSDFIDSLCDSAEKATAHHYTAKSQAAYLRHLKETLPPTENAIVLLDFAENYSFICQDAVQGFHWETAQATLHPFAIYYRPTAEDDLLCISACIISDDREHVAGTVHLFIKVIVQFLKEQLPGLNKIIYFSDGAAAQYKNCKNFKNLCCHEKDFGCAAEWNFFATSHGKSPCDGIGGTVKRLVARASLQATEKNHILSPIKMYNWAKENITGIHFFYVSKEEAEAHRDSLKEKFSMIQTIPGTRSHHRFVPVSHNCLQLSLLSADVVYTTAKVSSDPDTYDIDIGQLQPGMYIAAVYDGQWYVGCILEKCDEEKDLLVKFMHRNVSSDILSWPRRDDKCWVPYTHILCSLSGPLLRGSSGRQYKCEDSELSKARVLFEQFVIQSK